VRCAGGRQQTGCGKRYEHFHRDISFLIVMLFVI